MECIYVVIHLTYTGGMAITSMVYAYYDKQKAIEAARKLNGQNAKDMLAVSKKHGCNCVDHYFVECLPIT